MHVAQLPASHENGGLSPARRPLSSRVSPACCGTVTRRPARATQTVPGPDGTERPEDPEDPEGSEVTSEPVTTENRSVKIRAAGTPPSSNAPSTRSMNAVGPQ